MDRMTPEAVFMKSFFSLLEVKAVPYCVIHSYDDMLKRRDSDIDICIDISCDKLDEIIARVCLQTKMRVAVKIYYDIPYGMAYRIYSTDLNILHLDFMIDPFGINKLCLASRDILAGRKKRSGVSISDYKTEIAYTVIKRLVKKNYPYSSMHHRLKELYGRNKTLVCEVVSKYFGSYGKMIFLQLLQSDDKNKNAIFIKNLRLQFFIRQKLLKPLKWPIIFYYQSRRIISRILNPTGIFVCFLSPDGGGKTATCRATLQILKKFFRSATYLHWRPNFLPSIRTLLTGHKYNADAIFINPHGSAKKNSIVSILRWGYYALDYIFGYYFRILVVKIKCGAVFMDRYYYDVIVDPHRYGYYIPEFILKSILPLIPKPDLTIYLDNDPDEFLKRKQELSRSEIERQIDKWRELIEELPNARIITTDRPLTETAVEAAKMILDRRSAMTKKILKTRPEESEYLWKPDIIDSYIALPSSGKCRWIVPDSPVFLKNSGQLYLPSSSRGILYKNLVMRHMAIWHGIGFPRSRLAGISPTRNENAIKKFIAKTFDRDDILLTMSIGIGPFSKITASIMTYGGDILGYIKMGITPLSAETIIKEANALRELEKAPGLSRLEIGVPKLLGEENVEGARVFIQTPSPFRGKAGSVNLCEDYTKILDAFVQKAAQNKKLSETKFLADIKSGIESYPLSYKDLMEKAFDRLERHAGGKETAISISHGDFVPWNMLWRGKRVFIFDWESASFGSPAGIDAVHFLFQTGFLVKQMRGTTLLSYIRRNMKKILEGGYPVRSGRFLDFRALSLLYLLNMAISKDRFDLLDAGAIERRRLTRALI